MEKKTYRWRRLGEGTFEYDPKEFLYQLKAMFEVDGADAVEAFLDEVEVVG